MRDVRWAWRLAWLLLFISGTVVGNTIVVPIYTPTIAAIVAAINSANNGDTVLLSRTMYSGNCAFGISLGGAAKNITLDGNYSTIQCTDLPGAPHYGFYLPFEGHDTIRNVAIEPNYATNGTGILISGSNITLDGVTVFFWEKGISASASTLTLYSSTICNNNGPTSDNGYGVGISVSSSTLAIYGSSIKGNSAKLYGGGLFAALSTVIIKDSTFQGNTAATHGGAIWLDVTTTATITNTQFLTNTVTSGGLAGAIYITYYASVTMTGCTLRSNYAQKGGGIIVVGKLNVFNTTFNANIGVTGAGAIQVYGDSPSIVGVLNATSCLFDQNIFNTAGGGGGAHIIAQDYGRANISACNFTHVAALTTDQTKYGIYVAGHATVVADQCYFQGHSYVFYYETSPVSFGFVNITNSLFYKVPHAICAAPSYTMTYFINNTITQSGMVEASTGNILVNAPIYVAGCTFTNNSNELGMFYLGNSLTIIGTTFAYNNGRSGSAVYMTYGSLFVDGCTFIGNSARDGPPDRYGGALAMLPVISPCYMRVSNSQFTSNTAGYGQAVFSTAAARTDYVLIQNCTFTSHSTTTPGGVLYLSGGASITDCAFIDSKAGYGAAILGTGYPNFNISGCTYTRVIAPTLGGAIYLTGFGTARLSSMVFANFVSSGGGAVYSDYTGSLYADNCTFTGNYVTLYSGGAVYFVHGTISNSYFYNNTAVKNGGGAGSDEVGLIQFIGCTFVGNTALYGSGGAIASGIEGALNVSGVYARDNVAAVNGGGIYVAYVSTGFSCDNSTLYNNSALYGGGLYVGAVMAEGNAKMTTTTINNNHAQTGAGVYAGGYLSISNSTITYNTATRFGGGIYSAEDLPIADGTIAFNSAASGGGIYCRLCGMYLSGGLSIKQNFANDGGAFWCNAGSVFNPGLNVVLKSNAQMLNPSISYNCQCGCCTLPDQSVVNITTPDCILASFQPCGYQCAIGYEFHNKNGTNGTVVNGTLACDTSISMAPKFDPNPLCLPIRCPVIPDPINGTASAPPAPVTGDLTRFSCALGFSLQGGNESVKCLGPRWIGVIPICMANPCPVLTPPDHGTVTNLTGVYGNVVTFDCVSRGYTLCGTATATCLGTGFWSLQTFPTCEAKSCEPVPPPGNGTVVQNTAPKTGDNATFHCLTGWHTFGEPSIECQGGNWSAPFAVCAPDMCPTMDPPENGFVINPNATTGEQVMFFCNEGFYRQGVAALTCFEHWLGDPPVCLPVKCSTTVQPDTTSECDVDVPYNVTCNFQCVAGTSGTSVPSTCKQTVDAPTGVFVPDLPLCGPCQAGSFSGTGAAVCTPCPNLGRTLAPRTTSQRDCLCAPGFYEKTKGEGDCIDCPTGGSCSGDKNQPISAPGFFKNADAFVACSPSVACTGNNQCNEGYTGFFCGSCIRGYYQLNGYCHVCPKDGPWRIIVVVLAGLVLVRILIAVVKPEALAERTYGFGSISIALSFLQIVATFAELKIQWPSGARAVFDVFSAFNLNIEILNADCVAPLTFWDKTEIQLLMPIIVLAMFLVVGSGMIIYFMVREKPERPQLKAYAWKVVVLCSASFMLFLSLAYLFLAKAALAIFSCQDQGGGVYTLRTSPSNLCYDETWNRLAPLGVFGIIAYVIAVPIAVHAVFVRGRKVYGDAVARKSLFSHFLVNKYRPETWFWEVAVMLRKLLMVIVATFGVGDTYGQVAASFAVILVAVLVSLPWSPYRWKKHNIVECVSLFASLGVLFCGLLLSTKEETLPNSLIAAIDAGAVTCIFVAVAVQVACLALEIRIYAGVLALRTKLEPGRVTMLNAHTDRIVHIVPRQSFIVTVTSAGSVRSWHQDSLLPARAFEMHETVEHATIRGSELYVARGDQLLIWDLDLQTGLEGKKADSPITAIVHSEQLLITGHESGDLLFWRFRRELEDTSAPVARANSVSGMSGSDLNPVFISETADSEGSVVRVSSVAKPKLYGVEAPSAVRAHSTAVTALKRVGLVVYSTDMQGHIRKWSTKSFKQLRQWVMPVEALRGGVTITAIEEVTATLVVGTSDGSLHSLSVDEKPAEGVHEDDTSSSVASSAAVNEAVANKTTVHSVLRMQIKPISCLTLCNGMLLSASEDGRIIVLSGASGRLLQLLPDAEASVSALSVLEDGTVVYGDAKGILRKYRIIPEWHMQEPDPMLFTQLWTYIKKRVRGDKTATTATRATSSAAQTTQHDIYDELGVLAESLDLPAIPWRVLDGASAEAVALALAGETQKRRDHSEGLRRRNQASSSFAAP